MGYGTHWDFTRANQFLQLELALLLAQKEQRHFRVRIQYVACFDSCGFGICDLSGNTKQVARGQHGASHLIIGGIAIIVLAVLDMMNVPLEFPTQSNGANLAIGAGMVAAPLYTQRWCEMSKTWWWIGGALVCFTFIIKIPANIMQR